MTRSALSVALFAALLVPAAALAAPSSHANVVLKPGRLVEDPETGLPTILREPRFTPAASAVSDPTDTFLVRSDGFQTITGACDPRDWTATDLSSRVYAHVSASHVTNDGFLTMGTKALWFGADLTTAPDIVSKWVIPQGYGNYWSQRVTSPTFSRVAHPSAVLRFDAVMALRGNSAARGGTTWITSGQVGQEYLGVQALLNDGTWAHMYGRYASNPGPVDWVHTGPTFAAAVQNGTAGAVNFPNQVAVDASENFYVCETNGQRIQKFTKNGTGLLSWGSPGTGSGQFDHPVGVAVDAGGTVYVTDTGNNRIQRFTSSGTFIDTWGTGGAGPGQLNSPQGIAVEPGGTLLVVDRGNNRIQRFTTTGTYVSEFGSAGTGAGQFAGATGVAVAADGSIYVADTGNNRVQKFDAAGTYLTQWGSTGSGFGQFNGATSVAVDTDGSVFVTDRDNHRFQKFDANGSLLLVWTWTTAPQLNRPQGIAIGRHRDVYVSGTQSGRVAHWTHGTPLNGWAEMHYEVRIDQDGNQDLPLAEPLRLRIVMQTNHLFSSEEGNLPAGDDGINVVDNLSLTDGGGDVLAPVDFEDGTTGGWALSARNGYLAASTFLPSFIRDLPDPQNTPQVQGNFDANLPSCLWTFTGPTGYVEPGSLVTLSSPWIGLARSDSAKIGTTYNGKLNAFDQGYLFGFWMLGKNAGDTHARMFARGAFLLFGAAGNSDLLCPVESDTLWMPGSFNVVNGVFGPRDVDSVQFVYFTSDQAERLGINIPNRGRTRHPILDDIRIWVTGVDHDHDGVRDTQDACPAVNASGQDADGDGCLDPAATLKHIESWPLTSRPIHYALSQSGLSYIPDGSELPALRAGFAAWQAVPGSDVPLVEDATTAQTNAAALDGVNLLTFHDDYVFPSNVLAITPTTSFTRRLPFYDQMMLPGQIVDSDIIFNPAAHFRTATAGPATGSFDLQSVATHEIGHFLGLSHTGVADATMFPVLQLGTLASTLEADDASAVAAAYPSASFGTTYGAITGVVTNGTSGQPVPGAMVFAVLLDGGGAPADTVASDYTDEAGAYSLRRLAAGDYAVRIMPLDGSIAGVVPEAINAQVAATAQTNFQAEWYGGPEGNSDDPAAITTIAVAAGATRPGIDVVTNVDVVAPTVVTVSPAAGQNDVTIDAPVLVTFSEAIESGTLSTAFRLHKVGDPQRIGGAGQLLPQSVSFVFEPSTPLEFSTDYQIDLTTALTDRSGNALATTFTSTFRTQGLPPVSISDIEPRQAPHGALVTISGAGFEPSAENRVSFSTPGGNDYVLGTLVTPTSIVVQVPANAASGPVRVTVGGQDSNPFGLSVLTSEIVAPAANGAPVPLAFAPADIAVAPDGGAAFVVGGGVFARISLDAAFPPLRTPLTTSVPGAQRLAMMPNGLHAWVTSPDEGTISEIDTDRHSGSYGQAVTIPIDGEPHGIVVNATGQRAYVTDRSNPTIDIVDVDPASATYRHLLGTIALGTAVMSGGIAIDPRGRTLYVGTENLGLLSIDLTAAPPVVTVLDPTPVTGALAATPAGSRLLAEAGGSSLGRLLFRDLPTATSTGVVTVGGEPRDLAVGPNGGTAYVVNTLYARLQVLDVTQATPTQVASVATDLGPIAVAVDASGSLLAVANGAGHSVSLYNNAPAAVSPVRVQPPVAVPGSAVAIQLTGGPPAVGSSAEFDGVARPLDHSTTAAATALVPALSQRDGAVAIASGGTHSLAMPLRIVDPIETSVPRATGFVLDPVDATCGAETADGALPVVRVSPDGTLLALARESAGGCARLDVYRITSTAGTTRFGERLIDGLSWSAAGTVQAMAFTPDSRGVWAATDAGGMVAIDVDPSSPGFRSALPFGAAAAGTVRAIAADPYGRFMIAGAEPAPGTHQVQLWTTARSLVQGVGVPSRVHALTATPDGRYAVAGLEGRASFVDLDAGTVVTTTPAHSAVPPDALAAVAVSSDGRRAVGAFPGGRVAIWNTDGTAGAVGAELYFGIPAIGAHPTALVPAPDGHDVLAACSDGATFLELSPGALPVPGNGDPPAVVSHSLGQPARAVALTPDGRQLWVANWNDATHAGDVRLYGLSTASHVALVAGQDQSATAGSALPLPIQVQVTDAAGNPQAGVLVRFALADPGHGGLETPATTSVDRLSDVNGEASVAWTTPATPGALGLDITEPGSGASVHVTATATSGAAVTPPTVVEMGPANGATDINYRSNLFVRFSQAMDPVNVRNFITITANGEGVGATGALSSDGRTVFLTPVGLPYSAACVLTVLKDAPSAAGTLLAADVSASFSVQPQPVLTVTSVSPPSGPAGITLTLTGEGFDPLASLNTVRMGSVIVPITSVTPTSIVTTVPADALPGGVPVTVQVGSTTSNAGTFTVLAPQPVPLTITTDAVTRGGVQAIAITPDGSRAYISVPSSNTVLAFDLHSRQVLRSIPVGLRPQAVAVMPDGNRAYVANTRSNDISVIDINPQSPTYNRALEGPGLPIKVGAQPVSVVASGLGPQVLVLNAGDNSLSFIDAAAGNATFHRVTATASAGTGGKSIAVTPDGTRCYVATSEGVIMIDLNSRAVTAIASSGSGTKSIAISPDGTLLFALGGDGRLYVIDIAPGSSSFNRVVATASSGTGSKSIAVSPDGTLLYVAFHDDNRIVVFHIVTSTGGGPGSGIVPGPAVTIETTASIPVGAGPEDVALTPDGSLGVVTNEADGTVSLLEGGGSQLSLGSVPGCLTPANACVTIPVSIRRDAAVPLKRWRVDVQLSGALSLCGAIAEGSYLADSGSTDFRVTDRGGGAWTVEDSLVGTTCGASQPTGTLFTLPVTSSAASAAGSVAITRIDLFGCDGTPFLSRTTGASTFAIDNAAPAAVAGLAARAVHVALGSDGTTPITVSWPAVEAGSDVIVYRAPYGDYPEYLTGAAPSAPAYPPAAPWTRVATVTGGATSVTDAPASRDLWYYVAFVRDACGNVSPVSNATAGTLDYALGDVSNGQSACAGDNLVNIADISLLGTHYGESLVPGAEAACVDVAPTTNHHGDGRPVPDDVIDFEDLVIMAINYGRTTHGLRFAPAAPGDSDRVDVDAPAHVHAGETITATVRIAGGGAAHAIAVRLAWDADVVAPAGAESGGYAEARGGVVMLPGPGGVDAAVLGAAAPGLAGEGTLATFRFRALRDGAPGVVLRSVDARDAGNEPLPVGRTLAAAPARPLVTRLKPSRPNPFGPALGLGFSLARAGDVDLAVFGVDGRRVRTLVREPRAAGAYRLTWTGDDDRGHPLAAGVYYVRFAAPGVTTVQKIVRMP